MRADGVAVRQGDSRPTDPHHNERKFILSYLLLYFISVTL
tara:strand:+ start:822 stop:941 length:120 start_codon:yes stop_codon:yes gene_type:complete